MGLKASFRQNDGTLLKNKYIKIVRIWGAKSEGWNAFVGVYDKQTDQSPISQFHVAVPYVENENPYIRLYNEVVNNSLLCDVVNEVETSTYSVSDFPSVQYVDDHASDAKPEIVEEKKPKKRSVKK